ncbi:hypothetical protein QUA20_31255 [Microcoleus sp. Pol7_A1]|uniref:hypothetical protein n=1 Tax=unclassified Microcoleus TaxID=2642155 RepID=UPI002FD0B042
MSPGQATSTTKTGAAISHEASDPWSWLKPKEGGTTPVRSAVPLADAKKVLVNEPPYKLDYSKDIA